MSEKETKPFQFSVNFNLTYIYSLLELNTFLLSVDFSNYSTHSAISILCFDDDTEGNEDLLIH